MSQENVEIVTRSFEHFERTGEPLLDGLDPEVEPSFVASFFWTSSDLSFVLVNRPHTVAAL